MRNMNATSIGIAALGVFVLVALIYTVTQVGQSATEPSWNTAQMNDDASLPGTYYAPHTGADGVLGTIDDRAHMSGQTVPICTDAQIASGNVSNPLCYTSNPPTSGPHDVQPMPWGVLQNPAPKENLIHNMEHGGIVIWYNTTDENVINQLRNLTNEQRDRRRLIVLTQYPEMEANTVAITAWTRLDKFTVDQYDKKRLEDFISEHHKRFNPEGF